MGAGAEDPDFEAWARARGAALLRFAYLVTGDSGRAEEAVQDALVSVCPRWRRIVHRGDPEAYVRRTVVNAAATSWRRFRRREMPVADVPLIPAETDELADAVAVRDAAWALCSTLPARQRAAVVLRYYEGLSDAEIGAILGCSPGTVRSQIHRALAALRQRLQTQEEVDQG
ncbi:MAG: SigE family RNA polymerase sigma factor [Actinomycetes bacterium]|jgi:RNA polymerase sigma-70 factor (sigma-E family)